MTGMRVFVLGAGAMGKLFGARLALGGSDVTMIDVDPSIIEAIRQDGLQLSADDGEHRVSVRAGRAEEFLDEAELLLVFTKAPQTANAVAQVAHLVTPRTCVLSLQNGLDTGSRLAAGLPEAFLAIGTTSWPADAVAPGRVASHGRGDVRFWSVSGATPPILRRADETLRAAGLESRLDRSVDVAIWEKVIFNAVMNPVAALTRLTVGGMAASRDGAALAEAILQEAFSIARACRVQIDEARVRKLVATAFREHGPHRPSMLSDVLSGRRTEIDVISGALAERARQEGIEAPVMDTLARLVRMVDGAAAGS